MSRLRYDNALGTLGASLSSSGTTITFDADPGFSTLSGSDFIVLPLEPSTDGEPSAKFEIVYLTAYTATHTTGTITRGQEGTTGVSHASGAAWVCGPTAEDFTTATGLTSFNGRSTAAAVLTKADVTGTGLAASDVGADASGAAATAQSNAEAASLPLAGGTVSGVINMGSHKVTGLTNGSASSDAAAFGQIPVASTTTPVVDGTAAVGTGTTWAKADHVHPTDTSRAPTASPTLTGTVTIPSQTALDASTKAANTAYADAAVAVEKTRALAAEAAISSGSGLGPTTARRDATYTGKQIAVTRAQTPYSANFSYPTGASIPTYRSPPFTVGPVAISDIEANFGNWTSFPGDGGLYSAAATAQVKAALEYNGNVYALYFNGLRTIVLGGDANGGASAWSDPIGIEIPAGATFYIRSEFTPSTGTAAPLSNFPGGWSQAGDHVDATGTLTTTLSSSQYGYGCNSIRAVPAARVPQIALIGDSRTMGFGDATAGLGYIGRALGGSFVSQNLGALGEKLTDFNGGGHWLRGKLIAGADYATEVYGINDLSASVAAATVQAGRITVWNALLQRGIKTFADTLWPESTGTWTTTGGQTKATWDAARVTVNQWIRAGAPMSAGAAVTPGTGGAITAPVYIWNGSSFTITAGSGSGHPLAGCFDSCALVETSVFQHGAGTDSGIWKVGTGSVAWTNDGIHANAVGCAVAQAAIDTSLFV